MMTLTQHHRRVLGLRREVLLALPPEERSSILSAALREEVARLAQVTAPQVSDHEPLTRSGLDSLAAIELQHLIESDLGIVLEPAELLDGVDLAGLARRLLRRLSPSKRQPKAPTPRRPSTREPLTSSQMALWLLHRVAPSSGADLIAAAARVRPGLDTGALGRALEALGARHAALRTTFHESDGRVWQEVHERLGPELVVRDASSWTPAELREAVEREAYRPFELDSGALLRLLVFRRSPGEDVLVLSMHHLVEMAEPRPRRPL